MNRRCLLPITLALVLAGCAQYATVAEKRPRFLPPPPGLGLLAGAEQSIARALRGDRGKPLVAVGEYLDAAEIAARQLARDPRDATARRDYNFALARVFTTLRDAKLTAWPTSLRVPGGQGDWQFSTRTDITREPLTEQIEFIPADQIELRGTYVSERRTKEGLGAPLVAMLRNAAEVLKKDPFAQSFEPRACSRSSEGQSLKLPSWLKTGLEPQAHVPPMPSIPAKKFPAHARMWPAPDALCHEARLRISHTARGKGSGSGGN